MKNPTSKRPAAPGRFPKMKTLSDERGVSPVIAVILMVAITVVLASVLYVMVIEIMGGGTEYEKNVNMFYTEDSENAGKYILTFDGSKRLDKIEIKVYDTSESQTILLSPDLETYKESPSGLSISFQDVNEDNQLDATDTLVVNGAAPGDVISVISTDSGKTISTCTLS